MKTKMTKKPKRLKIGRDFDAWAIEIPCNGSMGFECETYSSYAHACDENRKYFNFGNVVRVKYVEVK